MLYTFSIGNGASHPKAGVILDAAGNLYGTTYSGTNFNPGTVFELIQRTGGLWQEISLYSFNDTDGAWPSAPLVFDNAGNLYGVTVGGGPANAGVVFALPRGQANSPRTEVSLYSFGYIKNGNGDVSGLAMDAQGNLYGVGAVLGTNETAWCSAYPRKAVWLRLANICAG